MLAMINRTQGRIAEAAYEPEQSSFDNREAV